MESLNNSLEPLLEGPPRPSVMSRLLSCLRSSPSNAPRKISILPPTFTTRWSSNLVSNTKYNVLTFLPLVLFNQFKYFQNFFFLMMALTQFVPILKVGLIFTYFAPLSFVISLTMIREAYQDIKRYYRDTKANSTEYKVLTKRQFKLVQSRYLRVGDIVEVEAGQRVPADMVLLYSDQLEGSLFIKTDQLDGETDWKLRRAVRLTQKIMMDDEDQEVFSGDFGCEVGAPSDRIYQFEGLFQHESGYSSVKEKLSLENTLWADTSITIGKGLGLIIYCGKQTRIAMGAQQPHPKIGIFDLQVNFLSKILFIIMLLTTTIIILLQSPQPSQIANQFIRKLILISYIFPLSAKVNLQIARLIYCQRINTDPGMPNSVARNSMICEDMARIKYLLTDKTGTLTMNEMVFRAMVVMGGEGKWEDRQEEGGMMGKEWRGKGEGWRRMVRAMALCHNVTPVEVGDQRNYQASSPDQITLVQTAERLGVKVVSRSQYKISIEMEWGGREDYDIIQNFHFSSDRKRMGILLRSNDKFIFYVKGADSIMCDLLYDPAEQRFASQNCKNQAECGLRTLVFAEKTISSQHAKEWISKFEQISLKLQTDHHSIDSHIAILQKNMKFVGISALQDKLQQDLPTTLGCLRKAGIRVWMVTGDKMETAEAVSISSGMTPHGEVTIRAIEVETTEEMSRILDLIQGKRNVGLVIDGKSLATALQGSVAERFFNIAMKIETVVCCRCTPAQKGKLVQDLRKYNKQPNDRIAAVGDGGNDVGMIQNSDIGIGLAGKQGKQAALAADFSLEKFKHIQKMFLWHGRLIYKRSSLLVQFIIYRGMLIGVMHAAFMVTFNYISIPLFHSLLQVGYTTIFTFFPTISLAFDEDITPQIAFSHPQLYRSIQQGRQLTWSTFTRWSCIAIYHAISIYSLTLYLFPDKPTVMQSISFSALILSQYLVSQIELSRPSLISLTSVLISIGIYVGSMFFLARHEVVELTRAVEVMGIFGITAVAVLPVLVFERIRRGCFPEEHQKVMQGVGRGCILWTSILGEKERIREIGESRELK